MYQNLHPHKFDDADWVHLDNDDDGDVAVAVAAAVDDDGVDDNPKVQDVQQTETREFIYLKGKEKKNESSIIKTMLLHKMLDKKAKIRNH